MKEVKRKLVAQRAEYWDKDDFVNSLRRMRQCGGPKQKASEKVSQIIGNISLGADELFKLTNNGEDRIQHCVKYDLPGACRLVTVHNDGAIWLLFVGDHEDTDRWIETHKGLTIAVNKKSLRVNQARVAIPQNEESVAQIGSTITDEDLPLLNRFPFEELSTLVPQAKLRRDLLSIREGTPHDEILETIELIPDLETRELIFDLIYLSSQGKHDQAICRLELYRGDAVDLTGDKDLLDRALDADTNTDNLINFSDIPEEELTRLLDQEKFDDWMLFLHPEQKKVVDEDFDSPAILKGVSGSGKSVVLIHRARRMAQLYPNETIGVLTRMALG